LSQNKLTCYGIEKISEGLKLNTTLESITLDQSNSRGGKKVAIDIPYILGQRNQVNRLSLYRRNYDCCYTIIISSLIIRSLENYSTTEIDLSHNKIGNVGGQHIAKILKFNSVLKDLNISNNDIGHIGTMAVADALTMNTVLTRLNIARNKLDISKKADKEAIGELACAVKKNTALTYLFLSSNAINILKFKANETSINCHRKKFTDMDALVIAALIQGNKYLKKLVFTTNGIGNCGARAFADVLRTNFVLEEFDLRDNSIGINECQALASLRTKNRKIILGKQKKRQRTQNQPPLTKDKKRLKAQIIT